MSAHARCGWVGRARGVAKKVNPPITLHACMHAWMHCRLRISLGLKPLNMEAPQKQSASDVKRQEEKRQQQEQEKTAEELRAKIAA